MAAKQRRRKGKGKATLPRLIWAMAISAIRLAWAHRALKLKAIIINLKGIFMQNRHALIVGTSGSGKTFFTQRRAAGMNSQWVAFDPMAPANGGGWNAAKVVQTFGDLNEALESGDNVVYLPPQYAVKEAAVRVIAVLLKHQKGQGNKPRELTLFIDEAHLSFPNGSGKTSGGALRTARHSNLGIVSITQALADLDPQVQSNVNETIIFKCSDVYVAGLERVAKIIGKEKAAMLPNFKTGEHFVIKNGEMTHEQPIE